METEAKFHIEDPRVFDTILALKHLGCYPLRPGARPEQQHNTYYDTPDNRLQARRHGLRLRIAGARSVVTLKSETQIQDGIHQRGEWELDADSPDPATWPDSDLRTRVLELIGDAPLVPLLTIDTHRRHIVASVESSDQHTDVAVLCLDECTITAGTSTESFCELEVELLPDGTRDDLHALLDALNARIHLIPENRSKLERGLHLFQENRRTRDDSAM